MAESVPKSRSESAEEISHHSLLERHRSPSASEIYTNARSYLSNDQVIQVIDDGGEIENTERGNVSATSSTPITNSISGSSGSSTTSSSQSKAKEKLLMKTTRYRSQSTGAVVETSCLTSSSTPPPSAGSSSSSSATGVALASKKPTLDRARTDNISHFKEFDKISSTIIDKHSTPKRNIDKPPKKNGSFNHTGSSSPDVTKQIVPPLSTTPELGRKSGKNKTSSSATKKLVSRSYNDGGSGANDLLNGGGLKAPAIMSTSSAASLLTTPPRHVGNLRDDLATHPPAATDSSNTSTHSTPVRDSSPSTSKSTSKTGSSSGPTAKLKGSHSRTSSPAPLEPPSVSSSRSNSGSSSSQLGIMSPLTVGGMGVDVHDNHKSGGGSSSVIGNGGPSSPSSGAGGTGGGSAFASGVGSGAGSGCNPFGKNSTNPFASAPANTTGASTSSAPQPSDKKKNIFEQRLQEAQALNRKELVEGAVMHEFSLWKNFSKANADTGTDIDKAAGKDGVGEVAPPKKSNRIRASIGRASDEALEQGDREGDNIESARSTSRGKSDSSSRSSSGNMAANSSATGTSSTSRRGVKIKPLSPVAATSSNVKSKSSRKLLGSAKKNKSNKVVPIAPLTQDEHEDGINSNTDGTAAVSSSSSMTKSGTKQRAPVRPLLANMDKEKDSGACSFELEDEHGEMQEYQVHVQSTPPLSPSKSPPLPHNQHTPTVQDEGLPMAGHSRGLARNFRSMVGSCKKSGISSVASDMDSILSEHSVDITDPFSMHRSVSDSIASIESSVQSNYDDGDDEMAILGVAHDDDGDVDLSFISEDDNCVMYPSHEVNEDICIQDGLDEDQNNVERTLLLDKGEEEMLEESLDAKELEEEVDSLLLSESHSREELSAGSLNHIPFSPRATDVIEEEDMILSQPPPVVKMKSNRDAAFTFEPPEECSLDQSAEVVNSSASFENVLIPDTTVPSPQHLPLPLLQPIQMSDAGNTSTAGNKVPSFAAHLTLKNKGSHLFGDTNKMTDETGLGGSAPSSSRLPTERTTERLTKNNSKYQADNNFNVNISTCVMSATLGSPPPLLKANLQAKQSKKRNHFQDKGSKEFKKSEGVTKLKSNGGKKKRDKSQKRNGGVHPDLSPIRQSSPSLVTPNPTALPDPVIHDVNKEDNVQDDDIDSISSELSEMSGSTDDHDLDYDPNEPFPMTEAEKEELQLQQHRQYLQMAGGRLGGLMKQGASTAPAALGSPEKDEEGIADSIEAAQRQAHQRQHQEDQDRMFKLENGFQWKKGNDVIGHGSFGQVYKGMNYDTGELLAVKQICLNDGTEDEVANLRKEIDVMKDLDHPNIVRYVGTSISSRHLFIVLEYVPGGSVAGTLSQFGAFSEPLIRRFVSQIITGVDYLHQKQIIHRDIKGANVLVTDAGVAKLADFGCSKQLGGMVTASLEESMRIIRGSVPWMAPEVIKQVGHGRSADLWSVGATMIEMATAKHPWPEFSNNLAALFHVATSKDPPPIPDHLSEACANFMSRCLVIDPKDRATAQELMEDPFLQ